MHNTFEELLAPLNEFMEEQGTKIDEQSDSRELFFRDFTRKLIYHFVMKIPSLQQLVTELRFQSFFEQVLSTTLCPCYL